MLELAYTIGSDPELFLVDTKTKKVVSAIDKIPGHKDDALHIISKSGFIS